MEREHDDPPARPDAAGRTSARDHDPQRRRHRRPSAPSRPASPASIARRSCSRAPATGPTRSTTASSPASRTRSRRCRSAPPRARAPAAATTSDDGGPSMGWLAIPGIALLLAAAGCSSGTARRRHTSRRRRESHHPRRRWPRLRGGGDDDRRLRRRRLGPAARAGFSGAGAGPQDGLNVWIEQGCGSCHTFNPANSTAPIGPDLALSLHGKSRDYVMESIVLPSAKSAAGYDGGMHARGLRAADRAAGPRPARGVPDAGRAAIAAACSIGVSDGFPARSRTARAPPAPRTRASSPSGTRRATISRPASAPIEPSRCAWR